MSHKFSYYKMFWMGSPAVYWLTGVTSWLLLMASPISASVDIQDLNLGGNHKVAPIGIAEIHEDLDLGLDGGMVSKGGSAHGATRTMRQSPLPRSAPSNMRAPNPNYRSTSRARMSARTQVAPSRTLRPQRPAYRPQAGAYRRPASVSTLILRPPKTHQSSPARRLIPQNRARPYPPARAQFVSPRPSPGPTRVASRPSGGANMGFSRSTPGLPANPTNRMREFAQSAEGPGRIHEAGTGGASHGANYAHNTNLNTRDPQQILNRFIDPNTHEWRRNVGLPTPPPGSNLWNRVGTTIPWNNNWIPTGSSSTGESKPHQESTTFRRPHESRYIVRGASPGNRQQTEPTTRLTQTSQPHQPADPGSRKLEAEVVNIIGNIAEQEAPNWMEINSQKLSKVIQSEWKDMRHYFRSAENSRERHEEINQNLRDCIRSDNPENCLRQKVHEYHLGNLNKFLGNSVLNAK